MFEIHAKVLAHNPLELNFKVNMETHLNPNSIQIAVDPPAANAPACGMYLLRNFFYRWLASAEQLSVASLSIKFMQQLAVRPRTDKAAVLFPTGHVTERYTYLTH